MSGAFFYLSISPLFDKKHLRLTVILRKIVINFVKQWIVMNPPFAIEHLRAQFPALQAQDNQASVTYLDSAATTQLPQTVIDRLKELPIA